MAGRYPPSDAVRVAESLTESCLGVGGCALVGKPLDEAMVMELLVGHSKATLVGPSLGVGASSGVVASGGCKQGLARGLARSPLGAGAVSPGVPLLTAELGVVVRQEGDLYLVQMGSAGPWSGWGVGSVMW